MNNYQYGFPNTTTTRQNYNNYGPSSSTNSIFHMICPSFISDYVTVQLDSLSKMINHLLGCIMICSFLVLIKCSKYHTGSSLHSIYGYNISILFFLLLCNSFLIWIILNNKLNRMALSTTLTPNEFMVGMTLGLIIGGTIVAYLLSQTSKNLLYQCSIVLHNNNNKDNSGTIHTTTTNNSTVANSTSSSSSIGYYDDHYLIQQCTTSMMKIISSIKFWSILIKWFSLACSVLIAVGRPELVQSTSSNQHQQYYSVPMNDPSQLPQPTSSTTTTYHGSGGGTFVGDYSTVPEVRPVSNNDQHHSSSNSNTISNATTTTTKAAAAAVVAVASPSKPKNKYRREIPPQQPSSSSAGVASETAHIMSV